MKIVGEIALPAEIPAAYGLVVRKMSKCLIFLIIIRSPKK